MDKSTADLIATILNSAWMVRHYARSAGIQRQQAILHMGLAVRYAFSQSEDFETLLAAVVDGLRPTETRPF